MIKPITFKEALEKSPDFLIIRKKSIISEDVKILNDFITSVAREITKEWSQYPLSLVPISGQYLEELFNLYPEFDFGRYTPNGIFSIKLK